MKDAQLEKSGKKGLLLTATGAAIMVLLTVTKVVPSSSIAGYSVFVGIAFFFIVEAVCKERGPESGLRFKTVFADLKKPRVIVWALLPTASGILSAAAGNLLFGGEYADHVLGRAGAVLSFDKIALLIVQVVVAAFGEEIAYRGFFLGKAMKKLPFWLCAVVSSAVFAAGHTAEGSAKVVAYDVTFVFVDSLIYSVVYRKTGNCVISAISHIVANAAAIVALLILL